MWSRALLKTETLADYREYADKNGYKMWFVFTKAFECLIEKENNR